MYHHAIDYTKPVFDSLPPSPASSKSASINFSQSRLLLVLITPPRNSLGAGVPLNSVRMLLLINRRTSFRILLNPRNTYGTVGEEEEEVAAVVTNTLVHSSNH